LKLSKAKMTWHAASAGKPLLNAGYTELERILGRRGREMRHEENRKDILGGAM